MIKYRAAKDNNSNDIIAIGYDENQWWKDYNWIWVWLDFTFDEIPESTQEINEAIWDDHSYNILKVEDNKIILKTLSELWL